LRDGNNSDSYYKQFRSISLPSSIAHRITKALLKADGFRLRRFLTNFNMVADLTRNRALALILFSAVCCN